MTAINNQRELGAALRDRRHNLGMTQAALAAALGVTRDWVIDLESGRGNPQLRRLLRALDVLGMRFALEHREGHPGAAVTSGRAEGPKERPHRGLPVLDLDEVLEPHRRRG